MVTWFKKLILLVLLSNSVGVLFSQEFSAGINTETPNQYAVLHLVAPNGNQGLLLPKLDTSQRTALASSLGTSESGLMVFDQEENQIYFWDGFKWIALIQTISKDLTNGNIINLASGGSINIGEGIPVVGQVLEWDGNNWVPAPPAGVQNLALTGNILDITSGNSVDLSGYLDNTDNQDLTLTGNTLSLTNDGTPVDLSVYLDNTDNQDLTLTGNTLSITNDGTPVDLSGFLDNTDNQDLSLTGNTLSLSNDGTSVDLSGYLDNTDDQVVDQFDLTGSTLNLSLENDGAAPYTVDLSTFTLPSLAGNAGNYLTNDGVVTSWDPLGALAQLDQVTSAEIADGSVGELELSNTVAGNGITGGDGSPLSVDLAPGAGLDFLGNQLQMEELYPGGTIYDGGASTAIRSITFDSKGRFVSATSVTVVLSDRRLKKEITHLDHSLEKVLQLNGYNYYLKSDSLSTELKTGVMAQEIKEVIPNLLLTRPDGYYGVDYQGLIPILLEAIKEQQVIIDEVKEELATEKKVNSTYQSKINTMEAKLDQVLELLQVKELPAEIN
ncbi:MAG: tail fiber domain-containing protein [Cyclobacteriaceae bacterium]